MALYAILFHVSRHCFVNRLLLIAYDNSACEGVFGRIKNEMFYNTDWTGVSISDFIKILNNYLVWYNELRIKKSLGYMSHMEYRRSLG